MDDILDTVVVRTLLAAAESWLRGDPRPTRDDGDDARERLDDAMRMAREYLTQEV